MSLSYSKPYLSVPDQVQLLASRGLSVANSSAVANALESIGYYRLSGYWFVYRATDPVTNERTSNFRPGTTLDKILSLYDFDRQLKLHLMRAIERIEIALRFQVGHVLGARAAYAHQDPSLLDRRFTTPRRPGEDSRYKTWWDRAQAAQARSSEDFVRHFKLHYGNQLPTWVITEILDFGGISTLYSGLLPKDRNKIAAAFGALDRQGDGHGDALVEWMRVINYIRNVCAHHSRLWNSNMDVQLSPKFLTPNPYLRSLTSVPAAAVASPALKRVFGTLSVILFLLEGMSDRAATARWRTELINLVTLVLPLTGRREAEMGFPSGWTALPLWK